MTDAFIPGVYCSIDIGSRHFAIRVERWQDGLHPLCELFELVDLAGHGETINMMTQKLTQYFMSRAYVLSQVTCLVVEEQRLIRNQITNATRNMRLMQHVFSYFQLVYPTVPHVELPPHIKTARFAGGPGKVDHETRKGWAVEEATRLFTERGDTKSLDTFKECKKIDDLADTVVQLRAFHIWRSMDFHAPPTKQKAKTRSGKQ